MDRGDGPNDVVIHVQVIVHDLVTHTDDLLPWQLRMRLLEFRRHASSGFSERLYEVRQC